VLLLSWTFSSQQPTLPFLFFGFLPATPSNTIRLRNKVGSELNVCAESCSGVEWRDLNHRVLLMSASDSSGESACKGAPEPCALPELRDTATSALRVVTLAVH